MTSRVRYTTRRGALASTRPMSDKKAREWAAASYPNDSTVQVEKKIGSRWVEVGFQRDLFERRPS